MIVDDTTIKTILALTKGDAFKIDNVRTIVITGDWSPPEVLECCGTTTRQTVDGILIEDNVEKIGVLSVDTSTDITPSSTLFFGLVEPGNKANMYFGFNISVITGIVNGNA